ncbi:pickpocket protein 28-like [Toxorhynchites rutilus septentrionalis]|uniref:pickpocket protein 28-like n=1 Tax=Toxorhynchites rutilus septentrionalis TaxID=329112 RepID=UPI00247B07B8|nr:pickpocket protein 28-like [Toxorhynchites rutilus septentrionalis]
MTKTRRTLDGARILMRESSTGESISSLSYLATSRLERLVICRTANKLQKASGVENSRKVREKVLYPYRLKFEEGPLSDPTIEAWTLPAHPVAARSTLTHSTRARGNYITEPIQCAVVASVSPFIAGNGDKAEQLSVNPRSLLWLVFLTIETVILVIVLIDAWHNFTTNPLITTLHNRHFPIEFVPFPALCVCSNNRISRAAAHRFAEQLRRNDALKRNVSFFLEQVKLLGSLYDFEYENPQEMNKFQQLLDLYDAGNTSEKHNISDRIAMLAPRCEDMLLRCFWNGNEFPCMGKNGMFEMKQTQYGSCCVFNSTGHMEDNDDQTQMYPSSNHLCRTEIETAGMMLLLNDSLNDYFYNHYNSIGFKLQIFNTAEIPDAATGGAIEQFIHPGTETFARLDATIITSEPAVRWFSKEQRGCLFRNELLKYGGSYGRSKCVAACRARSMLALCKCIPFYMATADDVSDRSITICNLQHVACLNKYKIKWYTVITDIVQIPGVEKEMEESLYCPDCLPSCSDIKYQISASKMSLSKSTLSEYNLTNEIKDVSEIALVRLFFGQSDVLLYKQDVVYYWFEILSNLGGMCGILAGLSLISISENVYFILRQVVLVSLTMYRRFREQRRRARIAVQFLK